MHRIISIVVLSFSFSFAQVTVTSNDLLGLIGNSGTVINDTTGFIQINVGSAGENQTWDFSSVNLQGYTTDHLFINPNQTPYSAQFPQANLAQQQTFIGDTTETFYGFFEITPSSIRSVGFAYNGEDSGFVEQSIDDEVTGLPLEYGNNWISVETDTIEIDGGLIIDMDSTSTTIDAWGSVTVPAGTFNCLRLCDYNVYISIWEFDGFGFRDTTTTISYEWITKDNFVVANFESFDGETESNFSLAESGSLLQETTTTTAIAKDIKNVPNNFILKQNYPNPFNPQTHISYSLPVNSHVTLKVFDNVGQEIKTLVNESQPAGVYQFLFDASGLSSGIYLYRLQTDNFTQVKRMILIK